MMAKLQLDLLIIATRIRVKARTGVWEYSSSTSLLFPHHITAYIPSTGLKLFLFTYGTSNAPVDLVRGDNYAHAAEQYTDNRELNGAKVGGQEVTLLELEV